MITSINPALLIDGYKADHRRQYPEGTEFVYSNFTPRQSRIDGVNEIVFFGLQYFIKEYLIERWNTGFFNRPKETVLAEYKRRMDNYLGKDSVPCEHIAELHDLGFLPIKIKAVKEGSLIPIGVPVLTIINTIPKFFWLTNYFETLMSNILWKPITSATTAFQYRKKFNEFAEKTGYDKGFIQWQGHDFSFRGMSGNEDSLMSGAGHLLSFAGTDTIPAIDFLEKYYNANSDNELIGGSVPACYDDKTEILTDNGWRLFKDLNKTELVAQYTNDKNIEFVKPLEYFKDKYKGKMVSFKKSKGYKYIDAVVTPNHKMVRLNDNKIGLFEAGDFSYQNRSGYTEKNKIIVSGSIKEKGKHLSSLDKLKIAFQADGSFPSHKEDYTGEKNKGFPIRFSLKKERKKERLVALLKDLKLEYSLSRYDNDYYSFWINVPEKFYKDFSWVELSKISFNECVDFINELQYWDGSVSNNCIKYSSINSDCIDMVQAICSLANYKTQYTHYVDKRTDYVRKDLHNLTIQNVNCVGGSNTIREEINYDGYVYCVSVPSKMIVVRRNNTVMICGNTEHSVMCMGEEESEINTFKRLITELYPNGIVSIVSDTWDFWKVMTEYLPALKTEILARNGRLVIRPDSGNPVDIICGLNSIKGINESLNKNDFPSEDSPEWLGAYEILWDIFGGEINEKGYKELNPKVGLIYGDSITLERQKQILEKLEAKGFSASNLVLGIGSFTYEYVTRDTFGFAMKATWGQVNGQPKDIFKNPKTDSGFKKSAKGLLMVEYSENGKISLYDQVSKDEEQTGLLELIFENSVFIKQTSLSEIRGIVNNNLTK